MNCLRFSGDTYEVVSHFVPARIRQQLALTFASVMVTQRSFTIFNCWKFLCLLTVANLGNDSFLDAFAKALIANKWLAMMIFYWLASLCGPCKCGSSLRVIRWCRCSPKPPRAVGASVLVEGGPAKKQTLLFIQLRVLDWQEGSH